MSDAPTLDTYLHHCLYFTANSLARAVGQLAEKAFEGTGLSPAHGFCMMLVIERPGITQKELAQALHLAPSTVTRFLDRLQDRGFVVREAQGRLSRVSPTADGLALSEPMARAWKALYQRYSEILGEEAGQELTALADKAGRRLEQDR